VKKLSSGLTSAPLHSKIFIHTMLPTLHASQSGVAPSMLRAFT